MKNSILIAFAFFSVNVFANSLSLDFSTRLIQWADKQESLFGGGSQGSWSWNLEVECIPYNGFMGEIETCYVRGVLGFAHQIQAPVQLPIDMSHELILKLKQTYGEAGMIVDDLPGYDIRIDCNYRQERQGSPLSEVECNFRQRPLGFDY